LNYQDDENNDDEKLQLLQAKTKKKIFVFIANDIKFKR